MQAIKQEALKRAITYLDSLGFDYIIRTGEEDIVKGSLQIADNKPKTRKHQFARGTFKSLYENLGIPNMKVGDVMSIPVGTYGKIKIQSTISSYAANLWGKGTYITTTSKDSVEIMRVKER